MNNVPVGIVGLGVYLPDTFMTAKEISEATGGTWSEDAVINKLGIRQKRIPSDKPCDGTQEMGALAALDCLKNTGIDPMEIDAILCFGEEWKELEGKERNTHGVFREEFDRQEEGNQTRFLQGLLRV